jgi:hypothetical protein
VQAKQAELPTTLDDIDVAPDSYSSSTHSSTSPVRVTGPGTHMPLTRRDIAHCALQEPRNLTPFRGARHASSHTTQRSHRNREQSDACSSIPGYSSTDGACTIAGSKAPSLQCWLPYPATSLDCWLATPVDTGMNSDDVPELASKGAKQSPFSPGNSIQNGSPVCPATPSQTPIKRKGQREDACGVVSTPRASATCTTLLERGHSYQQPCKSQAATTAVMDGVALWKVKSRSHVRSQAPHSSRLRDCAKRLFGLQQALYVASEFRPLCIGTPIHRQIVMSCLMCVPSVLGPERTRLECTLECTLGVHKINMKSALLRCDRGSMYAGQQS